MGMGRATLFLLLAGLGLVGSLWAPSPSKARTAPTLSVNTGIPAVAVDSLGQLVSNYRKWHKVNGTPIHMEPFLSALCRGPMTWEQKDNPHDPKFFTVYVNDIGKTAMMSKGHSTFPLGSVIVKEKLPSKTSAKVEIMTVMVKRRKGFDAKNGDWEYFTTKGSGPETSQENVAVCQSCHQAAKEQDFVFRSHYVSGAPGVKPSYPKAGDPPPVRF